MPKRKLMRIAGIDYSMTSPAICYYVAGDINSVESYNIRYLTPKAKDIKIIDNLSYGKLEGIVNPVIECQQERYEFIADKFVEFIEEYQINTIYLEDYSFGSHGKVFHIAENAGLLKYKLYKKGVEVNLVPPTVAKKFASGKGNANKNLMYESFVHQTGKTFNLEGSKNIGNPYSDIVDSYWLCRYGINDKQINK